MKKLIVIFVIILNGCASQEILKENDFENKTNTLLIEKIEKLKNDKKNYEEIEIEVVKLEKEVFSDIEIQFNFTSKATLKDLLNVFEYYNLNTIADSNIDIETNILINKFEGKLEDLILAVQENTNLTFENKNNVIYIKTEKNYKVKVVQDKEIIESVFEEFSKIENLKDLIKNENAGIFSFKSDYKTFLKINDVLSEINDNMSLINIDLSLIEVELSEKTGNGFDFETLNLAANLKNPEELLTETIGLSVNKLSLATKNLNMSIVMNILDTYGQSETLQNTSIKTLSGKQTSFKTIEKTPFIDKVEITNNGEFANTGFTTANVETGLELSILPFFDKETKMINASVELKKSTLKGFLNISNAETEIKQPQTEIQDFKSNIRLKTGESSVIGGIVYYKTVKSGNSLISDLTQSNKKEVVKSALFIIIKPSVKSYIRKR